jgi:hypothetical protein
MPSPANLVFTLTATRPRNQVLGLTVHARIDAASNLERQCAQPPHSAPYFVSRGGTLTHADRSVGLLYFRQLAKPSNRPGDVADCRPP